MKHQKKGFLCGFVVALALVAMLGTAFAVSTQVNATLTYRDIKICVDGQIINPVDGNGNSTEPFIINGTT